TQHSMVDRSTRGRSRDPERPWAAVIGRHSTTCRDRFVHLSTIRTPMPSVHVRRASPIDAPGIVNVVEAVAVERIYTAIDQAWSVEQEATSTPFRYARSFTSPSMPPPASSVYATVVKGLFVVNLNVSAQQPGWSSHRS